MTGFQRISIVAAREIIADGHAQVVDVRDEQAYATSRITHATHLNNTNLQDFLQDADPDMPVIVYCYHGNSSQSAAAFLVEKGFEQVYSVDGGFEHWRGQHPQDTESG